MTSTIKNLWYSLTSTLWFVPAVMTLLALCLGFGSIAVDDALDGATGWAYSGGPEGARELLAAIAASMITVAGVSFSVMIVALTLASQQFGPRLLRNFMRDTGNQIVLGTFIATFTYCLIVLRTIRSDQSDFVPHVSVSLSIVLALASLAVLIYFIHHAAVSIQAPELIAMVANDVAEGIERLFPEKLGQPPEAGPAHASEETLKDFEIHGAPIEAKTTGYLQSINSDGLIRSATESDVVVLVKCRPGEFVIEGNELARILPRERINSQMADEIRGNFLLGTQRTHLQDVEFSIRQLVEVAVRSLSPSVNDPFTAINCIDRITFALCLLAERSFPSSLRHDKHGNLRVIAQPVTFAAFADAAFDPIRQYGLSSAAVTIRLLEAIEMIAKRAQREGDRRVLLSQAVMIRRGSHESLPEERDRLAVEERFSKALEALRYERIPGGVPEGRARANGLY
jgi:uncharacterized membrane protein